MLEVIPAIDILGGKCVRLYQGDYAQSEVFGDDPATMAQRWAAEGATRLHLVDLDGAKSGEPTNTQAIAAVVAALDIPVQVGGGLRDRDRIAALFDLGVERAIVGTIAVEQPDLVRQLCQEFPGKIVVGIDARKGKVATRGWLETSGISCRRPRAANGRFWRCGDYLHRYPARWHPDGAQSQGTARASCRNFDSDDCLGWHWQRDRSVEFANAGIDGGNRRDRRAGDL